MKKNVVATRVGGLPEMIAHQATGLLCPANDSGALALAVQSLIDNPSLADQLREQAYQHALKTATFGQMMDGMLAVYENALAMTQTRLI
jgi:glycosyltransferase involved in cell wall biosynthesis